MRCLFDSLSTMRSEFWKRGFVVVSVLLFFAALLSLAFFTCAYFVSNDGESIRSRENYIPRKLLAMPALARREPNRLWGEKCSRTDIVVSQGPTAPLPNGIPTYTVEIMNACVTGCDISRIHLNCGWFSSARLINPKVFKRLRYDDCLVNDGKPLVNGGTLSFEYANTFPIRLSVSSVICS